MKIDVLTLMSRPMWQITCEEFVALHHYASLHAEQAESKCNAKVLKNGVRALAQYLSCCDSTIYSLKREGVLDKAIVSRIGKNIVFDAEKARILAEKYKQSKSSNSGS